MNRARILGVAAFALTATTLHAASPKLGGEMKHLFIGVSGTDVFLAHEYAPDEQVALIRYPEDTYPAPADVLEGVYYSGRYGWLSAGFINIPFDAGIFVRLLSSSDGLQVHEALTFQPILGTAGSSDVWQWSGVMTHNWYSASACGSYEATYEVYVGTSTGAPYAGYAPDQITLRFHATAPPGEASDTDVDGDVDMLDFAKLQTCFDPGSSAIGTACDCLDLDGSGMVDAADAPLFLSVMTGASQ